jgi:hypothetical protein
MKAVRAIWRFISASWLVAAPLVILALLAAIFVFLAIGQAIIGRAFGADAADNFIANAMVALAMALELALLGLLAYGLFCAARLLLRRKRP